MSSCKGKQGAICEECGKEYARKREWQKYCGPACRWANYEKKNPRKKQVGAKE